MKRVLAVSNLKLRHDALAAKMDLQTSEGDLQLEVPITALAGMVATAGNLALEAWRDHGRPEIPSDQISTAEISASSVSLVHRADGVPFFLFRVGLMNIAFPFDPQLLAGESERLMASLQTIAATNRARRGPKGQ